MITLLEAMSLVYTKLNSSELKTAVNGGIYKLRRPDSSVKDDVVINALPLTGTADQSCVVNVNIHVADIYDTKKEPRQYRPNTSRMEALAKIAISTLRYIHGKDYELYVEDQALYEERSINQHYFNLRIRLHKHNIY